LDCTENLDRDQILEGVKKCLLNCVKVDESKIVRNAKLLDDLGADSLDLIDFIFSLERYFDIHIYQGGIEKMAREGLTEEEFAENSLLRPKGVERLRAILSEIPPENVKEGMHTSQIPYLFTIETTMKMVERSLAEKAKRAE